MEPFPNFKKELPSSFFLFLFPRSLVSWGFDRRRLRLFPLTFFLIPPPLSFFRISCLHTRRLNFPLHPFSLPLSFFRLFPPELRVSTHTHTEGKREGRLTHADTHTRERGGRRRRRRWVQGGGGGGGVAGRKGQRRRQRQKSQRIFYFCKATMVLPLLMVDESALKSLYEKQLANLPPGEGGGGGA